MIGKTILHYKILEKLGEGGMGVVYLAEDTRLERKVAIKFLPHHIAANTEERERFKIEAKAAAALNHPNIATIHAIEEVDDPAMADKELCIVMEYIEGKELREIIHSEIPSPQSAINYATQIAKGLQAAHSKGIVHRDIKSSNIMVTGDGQIKIMDFGLAKVRGGVQVTKVGTTIGTAAYMSPEQARGEKADHRADIWSFGVVLYEMLTGQLPFKGDYEQAVIYSILNENPTLDENSQTEIPHALQNIVNQALQKNPEDRYQHIKDILSDLKKLGGTSFESKSQLSTEKRIPQSKTKKLNFIYYGIGAIILIVIAGYFIFSPDKSQKPSEEIPKRKMIVVLPLENLGSPDDEYFADGLSEEITSRLASFSELGVIARTSAIQYKNTRKTIEQIGEELNVEYVLEGTVRWDKTSGGRSRVRVISQLIRVSDATHLWSDRYDKFIDDIFSVQSDIAEKVIEQLDITLLESGRQALQAKPTENFEAYTIFLKGREYAKFYDERHTQLAIQMFEQAVSLDPDFAKAFSNLSKAHSLMIHFGHDRSDERKVKAKENADIALKLAPDNPESHIALGYYHYWVHRAYDEAEREFAIAERYQPNNADLLAGRAFVQRRQGRWKEAIDNLERALRLSPLNHSWYSDQGLTYTTLRKYDEAISYFEKAIKISDDFSFPYAMKSENLLLWKGDLKEARAAISGSIPNDDWSYLTWFRQLVYEKRYQSALDLLTKISGDMLSSVSFARTKKFLRGWAYQLDGQLERALTEYKSSIPDLEQKIQIEPDDFRLYAAQGLTYAALGEKGKAIRLGKKATEMYPVSKDVLEGTDVVLDLAWIYTMVGEHEAALEKLDYLLSIPAKISVPLIRLDPKWEALRSNPSYKSLIKKYSMESL